jgi:hypothetical protein
VQQQWQQQQQQQQQQEVERLQHLCRNPEQHWQHVHQQHHHDLHDHCADEQQLTWQQQQQQLLLQWPAQLVQPPPADEAVLLDISALWRENQQELLAGQQQQQQWQQQQHLLLQHQQVVWVTIHQPDGAASPAAVWVTPAKLELTAEQLQLTGYGEQQHVVVRLQRPDMGQAPAAVVEGLTFQHSSSLKKLLSAQRPVAAAAASEGNADAGGAAGDAAAAKGSELSTVLDTASMSDSSSSSGWYDYLLLSSGDFSVVEHANMFPNSLAHCGEGRALHNARGAADVASFVAGATEPALRQHMINLIRQAWDRRNYEEASANPNNSSSSSGSGGSSSRSRGSRGLDPGWVMRKILQRWGAGAMAKFDVDDAYFSARFIEAGVVVLPPPTVSAAVPDLSTYSSGDAQHAQL